MNNLLVRRSVLASILIGFGVAVLLFLGNPLGPLLFAFGLLSVCYLQADLYTGKAGYYWKNQKVELLMILLVNLASGYLFGLLLGCSSPQLVPLALEKIATWTFSLAYFIKSVMCGMVMYICVELFKRGNFVGILYGVPLFIFCGFQHSIANVIVLGIASWPHLTWSWTVLLCAAGNLIGSLIINELSKT